MSAVLKSNPETATPLPATEETAPQKTTDGFHLVIDALKLNDIDTIFGLVGIPITDLARLAQAEGMRFIGFRHEQHAGNAAAIAGYMTQEARHLPDRVGAGLPERPDGARQRHHQLLPDDPDQRLQRARDRRPAAGRLRRDGPVERRQALREGRVPRAACGRHRHRRCARDPRGRVGTSRRRLSGPAGEAARADHGRCGRRSKSLVTVVDAAPRQIPGAGFGRSARSTCSRAPSVR